MPPTKRGKPGTGSRVEALHLGFQEARRVRAGVEHHRADVIAGVMVTWLARVTYLARGETPMNE
jgi:hypothetical protein